MNSLCTEERRQYKIKWLINAVKLKGYKGSLSVGVCESTKKIALLRDSMITLEAVDVLVLYDVNVVNGKCEEGRRCLCSSCHFNETTAASLGATTLLFKGITPEQFEELSRRVANLEVGLKSYIESFDWQSSANAWFDKPPLTIGRAVKQDPASQSESELVRRRMD